MKNNILWFLGFILVLGLTRIIPHPPNFTPLIAVAIFAPYLTNDWRSAVPLTIGAMFVGDLYWGLHPYMLWTYSSIVLISIIASRLNLLVNCLVGPLLFFIVTNFGVYTTGYYSYTLEGLIACYIAAIPFFHMTLVSTLAYTGLFYVVYKNTKPLYRTV